MFEPKTITKARADEIIKKQPFFKRPGIIGELTARLAAVELMHSMSRLKFHRNWREKVRSQPFFGKDSSLPDIIKFRRPVPFIVRTDSLEQAGRMDEVFEIGSHDMDVMRASDEAFYYGPRDDIVQDAIRYGMGVSKDGERVDPRKMFILEPPIYTLEDICWNQMLDNAVLSK